MFRGKKYKAAAEKASRYTAKHADDTENDEAEDFDDDEDDSTYQGAHF